MNKAVLMTIHQYYDVLISSNQNMNKVNNCKRIEHTILNNYSSKQQNVTMS